MTDASASLWPDPSARVRDVAEALLPLPLGAFRGRAFGKDWLVTRSLFAGGASEKLVARSLDGSDYVSLNLYRLEHGPRLKPCEMSAEKVARFVVAVQVLSPAQGLNRGADAGFTDAE